MPKKVIKITTHIPSIPNWLKMNSSFTVPLPLKSAKELAKKLSEVQDDVEIQLNIATGEEINVEIKYDTGPND